MKTIKLTQGKFALVDDKDFERINKSKWYANNMHGYWRAMKNIRFKGKRTTLFMARYILNVTDPKLDVDHSNGKTLDNQKSNLRVCSRTENLRNCKKRKDNKSGYKGVSYYKRDRNWQAYICVNYKIIHLGFFNNPKLAHTAYCKAALKYHKEFAHF